MKGKLHRVARNASRAVGALSEGLFSHAVDMALWSTVYFLDISMPSSKNGKVWRAEMAADSFLGQVNYTVIKTAIFTAKRRGWIIKSKRHAWPQITEEGRRRLSSVVPTYDQKRLWDKCMHVVTYDIPEKRSEDRYFLRQQLRSIGCGRLQDSVWITPYNPIDTLRSFIEEKRLSGTIIVSDVGQGGSIGEESVHELVTRVYNLEELNKRYEDWLVDIDETGVTHWSVVKFLAILQDDPQLPFSLLPFWWKGDKAYREVKPILERLSKNFRPEV